MKKTFRMDWSLGKAPRFFNSVNTLSQNLGPRFVKDCVKA
jgi:hypothetical protein